MPRFVLLYHDCPPDYQRPSHWDLMFEAGAVLRTWALEQLPRSWKGMQSRTAAKFPDCPLVSPDDSVSATMLGDHRREYLSFEGQLSGGRGAVIRVAAGSFDSEIENEIEWKLALFDSEIDGRIVLTRSESNAKHWTLRCLRARDAAL
jgi:hypothetical protein